MYTNLTTSQASNVQDKLDEYANKVNAINSKEGEVLVLVGVTVVLGFLLAFASGGAAAGLAVAGLTSDSAGGVACLQLGNLCNDAQLMYHNIRRDM